ncbi:hypothetical protein BC938DRAFT_474751 [Jimgerdemannia flammicorona]|uniref:Uncharacterized protein n=1 Tax=Jimgerdemannia flammicorona TaxID=994334 RepID=A0A433Q1R9_9FUNG|nr:hypothetical protein BC938DRAFT_474751 [Jimgerdemannia flammicorona]
MIRHSLYTPDFIVYSQHSVHEIFRSTPCELPTHSVHEIFRSTHCELPTLQSHRACVMDIMVSLSI